jgi:hypothetical protein
LQISGEKSMEKGERRKEKGKRLKENTITLYHRA